MKYLIRKVPERDVSSIVKSLLSDGAQKDDITIFEDVNHEGALWSFTEACRLCTDDTCFLQDDVTLCKRFPQRLTQAVKSYGNMIISLFRLSTHKNKNKYGIRYGNDIWFSFPGLYIPIAVIKQYVDWYDKEYTGLGWQKKWKDVGADDGIFYGFVIRAGLPAYNMFPNIVQHNVGKSVIGKKSFVRQTDIFVDSTEVN